ncbi:PH domain-containing protein [Arthrobacter sp. H20]|uniref:PH domain-containing protein n=1 Tax=Arthrobacter sp. H20 TaxID=1267981 RepID=UPI0004BAD221|nr:PH domain-containing protein [Arthrobacter sp. H20]
MTTQDQTPPENPVAPDGSLLATSEDQWSRVHVISPLVRGWIALVAIAFFAGQDLFEGLLSGDGMPNFSDSGARLPWAIAILAGIVVLVAVGFLLSWYFTRYQVTEQHVRVNSGVLFRQNRQARLDRVQAIDVVQPFLARVFGLAELKFEVADAGESAVKLAFLKLSDAQRLRATILARAAGVSIDPDHPDDIQEAPEREVLALKPGRVIAAALLSGTTLVLIIGVAVILIFSVTLDEAAPLAVIIPLGLGVAGGYWGSIKNGFNFRAAISPDGIRVRYGLLDTRTQTVPPGRIQAVGISQSPLWRIKGWYRMTVNVAGYGVSASGDAQARATLLPVGTQAEALQILALVLPDPGTGEPFEVFSAGMAGRDSRAGFVSTPRRARWIGPLEWRRNGFAVTDTALLIRSGYFWRNLAVVPHERTQSLALHQGPVYRRFRVADLLLHTTPGPVSPRIQQVDEETAWQLFNEQGVRAAEARRRSLPEQWMKPVEGAEEALMPQVPSYDASAPVKDLTEPAEAGPAPAGEDESAHNGQR